MVVGLFALLGFVYVPLGHKTGFEHLKAIAQTGAAREAIGDLTDAALWARARLVGALTGTELDPEPTRPIPARDKRGPKPKVPPLGAD
jgi:hypothetical protein